MIDEEFDIIISKEYWSNETLYLIRRKWEREVDIFEKWDFAKNALLFNIIAKG